MNQKPQQKQSDEHLHQSHDDDRDPGHRWQRENPTGAAIVVLIVLCLGVGLLFLIVFSLKQ